MTTTQWVIGLIVALIGGGAMGAVITALVTKHRNRRQPVGNKIEFFPVLRKTPKFPSLKAILMDETSSGSGPGVSVDNLYLARITVVNNGNQDINEFKFGVTLKGTDQAINVITETPDRHHIMSLETPVSLASHKGSLDFICLPFNRKETYIANVYIITGGVPNEIQLSSPHSTQFVELPKTSDATTLMRQFKWMIIFDVVIMILFALAGVYLAAKGFSLDSK